MKAKMNSIFDTEEDFEFSDDVSSNFFSIQHLRTRPRFVLKQV